MIKKQEIEWNIKLAKLCSGELMVGKYDEKLGELNDCLVVYIEEGRQHNMLIRLVSFFGMFDQSLSHVKKEHIIDSIQAPDVVIEPYIQELKRFNEQKKELKKEYSILYH